MFVPPFVLDALSRSGNEASQNSIAQSKVFRELRREAGEKAAMPAAAAARAAAKPKKAPRKVFDCEHTWQMRVTLIRDEGDPASGDKDGDTVYDLAQSVRDFWAKEMKRNSIDNLGMPLIFNVHFGSNYMNAFWDGEQMVFGDGDGQIFSSFAQSLDVVAHELGHGVTQYTANLDYYSQSGALNEHYSDVWGSVITQFANKQDAHTADWLIGDEIMGSLLQGEALRSMKAPGTAYDNPYLGRDPQPDHMANYYSGWEDNEGVHINSGIPNKVFYLVAMDVGTLKAARIWYHTLQRLWSSAAFSDFAVTIVESARQLTASGTVPIGTVQNVRLALKTVGLY